MSCSRRFIAVAVALIFPLVPVCIHAAGDEPVVISANDQMKFDTTDITGKVGERLTIKLSNDGSMPKEKMAHNIAVLKPGTDVAAFVADAAKHPADDYMPNDDQAEHVLTHTKLLGPGEEDTISFTPLAPGVYEYVCTYPGHAAAGMRGTITVRP